MAGWAGESPVGSVEPRIVWDGTVSIYNRPVDRETWDQESRSAEPETTWPSASTEHLLYAPTVRSQEKAWPCP